MAAGGCVGGLGGGGGHALAVAVVVVVAIVVAAVAVVVAVVVAAVAAVVATTWGVKFLFLLGGVGGNGGYGAFLVPSGSFAKRTFSAIQRSFQCKPCKVRKEGPFSRSDTLNSLLS